MIRKGDHLRHGSRCVDFFDTDTVDSFTESIVLQPLEYLRASRLRSRADNQWIDSAIDDALRDSVPVLAHKSCCEYAWTMCCLQLVSGHELVIDTPRVTAEELTSMRMQ